MGRVATTAKKIATGLGIDPTLAYANVAGATRFAQELKRFRGLPASEDGFRVVRPLPMLADRHDTAGTMSGHYFHQDLLVAQRIFLANPDRHIDVGSRTDGFVAHVAAFREIEVLDIRPSSSYVRNISFIQADLMQPQAELTNSTDSLSSLHAIEHFGLGRYGDPIDPNGHLRGIESLHAILRPGGTLYFSVPIGEHHVAFNAHRVFEVQRILDVLQPRFELTMMSFVDDAGALHTDVDHDAADRRSSFGCTYGCGIFELTKHP